MAADLRVLHLLDTTEMAGTEFHVLTLIMALRERGVNNTLACREGGLLQQAAEASGIETLPMPPRFLSPSGWRRARELIVRRRVDVLHAHNGRMKLFVLLLRLTAGARAVFTQHFLSPQSTDYRGLKKFIAGTLHRWAGRRLDHTIAISDAVRDAILQRREGASSKICTVYNGIRPPMAHDLPQPLGMRRALALSEGPFIFCAARLQEEKDIPTLIRAMSEVVKQVPAARCLIAGEGDLRDELTALIDSLNLSSIVSLLGFRRDVPALMNACDVFVLPSRAEPFGLVVIEAMALKKPVVAIDKGGPREIVDHPSSGLLVPASNPQEMASAIIQILRDPLCAERMGNAAHERFEHHFTAEAMASSVLRIYKDVTASTIELQYA